MNLWIGIIAKALLYLTIMALLLVFPSIIYGLPAAAFVLLATLTTWTLSALALNGLYEGSTMRAFKQHLLKIDWLAQSALVIQEGRIVHPKKMDISKQKTPAFGPRLIVVGPCNAAVMECGPKQTRVVGPTIFVSKPYEYVRKIYNLRCRQETLRLSDVLTQDLIPTTVDLCLAYGLRVCREARVGQGKLTESERQTIQWIDLNLPDWETAVKSIVHRTARRVIGARDLIDVVTPQGFAEVEQQVLADVNALLQEWEWGLHVERIVVEYIQPQEKIMTAAADRWIALAVEQVIETSKAESWHTWLTRSSDGYGVGEGLGVAQETLQKEALYRALLEVAKNVTIHIAAQDQNKVPFILPQKGRPV